MISVISYRLILLGIAVLPQPWAFALARQFGRIRYRWLRTRRWKQAENLRFKLVCTNKAVEKLLCRSFELEVSDHLESALFQLRPKSTIEHMVDIRGLEHLDAALRQGNGAILYSGHVWGNYTFFASLGLRGYRTNLVRLEPARGMSRVQRWFHDRFSSSVESFGCRALWYQPGTPGSSAGVAQALSRNEIVIILVDLSQSKRNVPVSFFGEDIGFPTGPIVQAKASGAPLLDFFVYRPDSWYPEVAEIGQPYHPQADIVESVQHCARCLEEQIRQHPAEWAPWHVFGTATPSPTSLERTISPEGIQP